MQVVRAGPDVQGDQGPEVHDRQAIGIHRPFGLLGHEVVHHPQKASGEEKTDGIVPIPPLHHGIGRTGINRIGFGQADRQFHVVNDVQNRHGDNEGAEEPVAHIDMLGLAFHQRAEEHHGVGDPDDGDQNVDGPLKLRIFLGTGVTQGQRDGGQHDDQLPGPEREGCQAWREQRRLGGALYGIVGAGKQGAAAKSKNHRIGVQGSQATEAGPGQVEVERRPDELRGEKNAEPHPDDSPNHRHNGELADHLIVVGGTAGCVHVWDSIHGYRQTFI
ncbi:hypothetical protein D3C76_891680 [compost metagenome]